MERIKKEDSRNTKILVSNLFSKALYKIKFSDKKANQFLLSTDLLKNSVKKDLLVITILRVEKIFNELLLRPKTEAFTVVQTQGNLILTRLIKNVCEDFLTKQYGYKVKIDLQELKQSLYTKNLLRDTEIIFQVPFFALVDPKSPLFRLIYYPIYNSASISFIEALIDNLVLEIGNCVTCFLILNYSSVYSFRQTLYRSKFLSLRNFERFKNNLNWQANIKSYINRPISLYNNKHEIYVLRTSGIYCRTIYANRSKEIASLSKVSLVTIVFIELRDFVSSRLDETLFIVTKGLRFTLTSVIGQVIGLIWRGVIEGLKK